MLIVSTFLTLPGFTIGEQVAIKPADTGKALVNPGFGWTMHFYFNFIENYSPKLEPPDTLDDWAGLSTIYLRVPWSYLSTSRSQSPPNGPKPALRPATSAGIGRSH